MPSALPAERARRCPTRAARCPRGVRHGLLALALGIAPGWADAWTLDALLRLPLEQLLRLDAVPQSAQRAPGPRHSASEGKLHAA